MKLLVFLVLSILLSVNNYSQESEIFYLSGRDSDNSIEWDFMVTGGRKANEWSKIQVPSNWELKGFGTYNYGHDENKADEKGLYKFNFKAPDNWKDKRVFIVFEGAMTDTEVKINGQLAGPVHQGGFYQFEYEITNILKFGQENLLEAIVSKMSSNERINLAERKSDYWVFGGIYRPVYLKVVPNEYISWTAIDGKANGEFNIDIHLNEIIKPGQVEAQIIKNNGTLFGSKFSTTFNAEDTIIRLSTQVPNPETWTAESPNLYSVDISLKREEKIIHIIREQFGFRTIEVREGKGIFLNENRIILKGCDRHSFRASSGRAVSRKQCLEDIMLLKEMNMNAVRMSHYPPDAYFLELCDQYGIYVLDELAGWQKPPYDTPTGRRLVKQLVKRDVNHPSVLFWDNGNEGGWNTDLDNEFAKYDPQNRRVLHPWEYFGGIDTDHYESYSSTLKKLKSSNIYMSTESIHGLYDGGLGAGLDDYWKAMWGNPLNGGMFLWVFADEGVVRTDQNGRIDTDGNHAPDGILGPFHEKEASFFTIKEIWSPVYIETNNPLLSNFNGKIPVENRFDFTNLNQCLFEWKLLSYPTPNDLSTKSTIIEEGRLIGPNILPHENGNITIDLPASKVNVDAISLTAFDQSNEEINTWVWKLKNNKEVLKRIIIEKGNSPSIYERNNNVEIKSGNFRYTFDNETGMLIQVNSGEIPIPFKNGPFLVPRKKNSKYKNLRLNIDKNESSVLISVENHPDFKNLHWTVHSNGWLQVDYTFYYKGFVDYLGVSFEYPEDRVKEMKWLGKGPYRVWKNRLKGPTIGVWQNSYNSFQPGLAWDYPEFPGYYANFNWVVFNTSDGPITIATDKEDIFLRVYSQPDGNDPRHTSMIWPEGDISFLHAIPPIGTKFMEAKEFGPQGQKFEASGVYSGTIYLYFGLPD